MRALIPKCWFVILSVGAAISGCSDADDNDKETPQATAAQTATAAKSLTALQDLSSLGTSSTQNLVQRHIASAFQRFQSDKRRLLEEDNDFVGAICTLLNTCGDEGEVDFSTDGAAMDCSASCRGDQEKPLYTCAMTEPFARACDDGVTYTVAAGGIVRSGTSCRETDAGTYAFVIDGAYDMTVTSSDGELDSTSFKCSWSVKTDLKGSDKFASGSGQEPDALVGDCSEFSCTIDGAAVSCKDIKKAIEEEDNSCTHSSQSKLI